MNWFRRIMVYVLGMILLPLGQRLFVEAGFGAGSLDALCVGLADRLGFTAGIWILIASVVMMTAAAVMRRRKPSLMILFTSYLFGAVFDFWGWFFNTIFTADSLAIRIGMYVAGILLAPLGTAIYFRSGFAKSALDEFIMSVRDTFKLSVRASKTIVEASSCILAIIFGGPIGVATVVTAFIFGPILQFYMEAFDKTRGYSSAQP